MKLIANMLRKENTIKWMVEARESYGDIKKELTQAHVFISPYFSKEFLVFSFSSELTIAGVLL